MLEIVEVNVTPDEYRVFRNTLFESSGDVKHKHIIGSLRKVKAEDDSLLHWIKNSDDIEVLHCSSKIDGMSMVLEYRHGELVSALTRGDGTTGVQQFDKIKHIVPNKLNTFTGFIRGEVTLTFDTFLDVIRISGRNYKNLRNTTVGIVNRKDTDIELVKCLRFYAYRIIDCDDTVLKQFQYLNDVGFETPIWKIVELNLSGRGQNLIDMMVIIYNRMKEDEPYEIDGVVIHNEFAIVENAMLPSNTIAFKVNDLIASSKLLDVKWQLSKYGLMKPVGIIEPVELGGAMISRVTFHNYNMVKSSNFQYGDIIKIEKAGDIIPHFLSVLKCETSSDCIEIPVVCPSCGSTLIESGVDIKCTNLECPHQLMSLVVSFIKKVGIKGVSEKSMVKFGITDFESLLTWTPNTSSKNEVKFYDDMQSKLFSESFESLFSKMPSDGVGERTINKLLGSFTLIELIGGVFENLPSGVSQLTMDKFYNRSAMNYSIVERITQDIRYDYDVDLVEVENVSKELDGQSFCFTGSLKTTSRSDASKVVTSLGGIVKSGVSNGLTYLVTNTPDSGSAKNKKAQKLGTQLITELEFIKLTSNLDNDGASVFEL